jgi:hypothetical protein
MNGNYITDELAELLGEADFVRLVEEYGGTRLYVPQTASGTQVSKTLGEAIASRLSSRYGRDYLLVPLARDLRTKHYRAAGLSNAQIARRLGITESGVERIFRRLKKERLAKTIASRMRPTTIPKKEG